MCGITGIIDLNRIKKFPLEKIMIVAGAIEHRGPDECGILNQPGIALASRRLSIVDLEFGSFKNRTFYFWYRRKWRLKCLLYQT
jgi:asparagine synthase (glutamine-hydrolysing)